MKKIAGLIAALSCASALAVGAGAQGVVNDVINGAENIVDDAGNAVENIVGGGSDRNNGSTIGSSGNDNSIIADTDDDDIPDEIEDDAGKDENFVPPATDEKDPNPSTGVGVPFMTAGLVLTSAAGVAYLTRKRKEENLTK